MSLAEWLSSVEAQMMVPGVTVLQQFLAILATMELSSGKWPQQANVHNGQVVDFLVVGAGSAGCVIANRLTEIDNVNVLLLEAGGLPSVESNIPALFPFVDYSYADWNYYTEDDGYSSQAHKTRNVHMTRGKMLGGSSAANYMFYVRGNKADYQAWVDAGNEGWDWHNVTKYFIKSERMLSKVILDSPSGNLHGTDGYLGVTRPEYPDFPDTQHYIDAFNETGRDIILDYNGYEQLGFSMTQYTIANRTRQSTSEAFLKPIKDRANLHVLRKALVTKIIFDDNKTATGVRVILENGKEITVYARKEIILSAGVINTPQLLMLSGIGIRSHLEEMNIDVVQDLPVGDNLQDHPTAFIALTGKKSLLAVLPNLNILTNLDKSPNPMILGHVTLSPTQTYPDFQALSYPFPADSFLPVLICAHVYRLDNKICTALANAGRLTNILFIAINLLHPRSKGRIRLQSTDPKVPPLIYSGYYNDSDDLELHAKCIEDIIRVVNTSYLKEVRGEVVDLNVPQCKDHQFGSHEYWKCHVLNLATTSWQPTSTCPMGPEGVLDERLRVRGVKNLRVADASIMPSTTSCNTNAPTIMIGEKASDMIKLDNGFEID